MLNFISAKLFGSPAQQPPRQEKTDDDDEEDEDMSGGAQEPEINADGSEILASGVGDLYFLNPANGNWDVKQQKATFQLVHSGLWQYHFQVVSAQNKVIDRVPIVSQSILHYELREIQWILVRGGKTESWKFSFHNDQQAGTVKTAVKRAHIEHKYGQSFEKVADKGGDQQFLMDADETFDDGKSDDDVQDTDMMDFADAVKDRSGQGRDFTSPVKAKSPERNEHLAVAITKNRSFVVRGNKVGVFKHDDDDNMVFVNKIPAIQSRKGELFSPAKALLHQKDSKLLLLNPEDKSRVYCMDLETQKVIDEWEAGDNIMIGNLGPTEKYAQRTDDQMVLGVNDGMIFALDPRLPKANKMARQQILQKPPGFTSIATTGEGFAAVANRRGEIRLYNDIEKRAKTLLPGLGDRIRGLDVTQDGRWILATCETYLLVVDTSMDEGKSGFETRMGDQKPAPIKLQLQPYDLVKYNIQQVNFTPAHFNIGDNISEQWIVSSTGPYIVTWNFRKVKQKKIYEYKIKRLEQNVSADQFRFNHEEEVVVACDDDVLLQKRR